MATATGQSALRIAARPEPRTHAHSRAEHSDTLYSLVGQQLKLDDAAAVQPYLDQLRTLPDVEEVRFGGNTLGVQACEAIAKELESKRNLRVSRSLLRRVERPFCAHRTRVSLSLSPERPGHARHPTGQRGVRGP